MAQPATDTIDPADVLAQIAAGRPPIILDVRSLAEFSRGHLPGARLRPFWRVVLTGLGVNVPASTTIVVYCGHGPRAELAAASLRLRGFRAVRLLRGHMAGWRHERHPEDVNAG
jgi:hydroxyacylglutathione hydrolase